MSRKTTAVLEKPQPPTSSADYGSVAALAYQFWMDRGCPIGTPEVDWFHAEEELNGRGESEQEAA